MRTKVIICHIFIPNNSNNCSFASPAKGKLQIVRARDMLSCCREVGRVLCHSSPSHTGEQNCPHLCSQELVECIPPESNSRSFLGETGLSHLQNEPCWKQALASRGLLLHKLPLCLGTFLLHTDQDLLAQRTCFHVPNCKHQKSCHCSDMTFSYSQAKHFFVTAPTLTLKLYVLYMTVKNNHCIVVVC